MDCERASWIETKHVPSHRTEVLNLIRSILERDLKLPESPSKPIINLGLGKFFRNKIRFLFYFLRGAIKSKWVRSP